MTPDNQATLRETLADMDRRLDRFRDFIDVQNQNDCILVGEMDRVIYIDEYSNPILSFYRFADINRDGVNYSVFLTSPDRANECVAELRKRHGIEVDVVNFCAFLEQQLKYTRQVRDSIASRLNTQGDDHV